MKNCSFILILLFALTNTVFGQVDSLSHNHKIDYSKRKKSLLYGVGATYAVGSTSLYFAWYKQNPQSSFHFFDDNAEWVRMDKLGHIYSGYNQALLMYKGLRWAGYEEDKSILYGSLVGIGFQSTIEILDGFSSKWGFSNTDFIANIVGVSGFALQQKLWREQRISLKMSYWPVSHPRDIVSSETGLFSLPLNQRAESLFGTGIESFLKDYNGQTIWLSFNISSFFKDSNWPEWLSLAIGYSGDNLYGGFENRWELNDENFILDQNLYPRQAQLILSLDYNLKSIHSNSPFVNTLLELLDLLKWPAPAIEYTKQDGLNFKLLFFN